MSNPDIVVKETVENHLDSHRDRQVVKALVAELTNTSFAARLQGLKSRKGTSRAREAVTSHLQQYEQIRSSQVVRNNMTNSQRFKLTEWIISTRKLREIKTIGQERGRKLKCQEFPELVTVPSYMLLGN